MATLSAVKRQVARGILDRATKTFRVEYDPDAFEFAGVNHANGDTYWGRTPAAVGQQMADWTARWASTIRNQGDEGVDQLVDECRAAQHPDTVSA